MIVPTSRLLWCTAVLVLAALLPVAVPAAGGAWVLGLTVVGAVALGDLIWARRRRAAPAVHLPPVVRLAKDRPGGITVRFERHPGTPGRFRFALGLPPEFDSAVPEIEVELPSAAPAAQATWQVTARQRGRFHDVLAACELPTPLGLWKVRSRTRCACEIRVYPDLMTEQRTMAALFLDRARFGAKLQRTVGRGREFEKLREYLPGDGFDEVHWKATAKRGHPITKVFQAGRMQEIYVVIDTSRLSGRPVDTDAAKGTALERYLTAALVLLLAAEQQGDRFGLVTFTTGVDVFLRAGRGRAHYGACREAVHALQPATSTPDPAELVRALRTRLRQRALLFILTDLSDPVLAEEFVRHLGPLARQHLVMVNQVRPSQVARLFDGEDVQRPEELVNRLAGHLRWLELRATAQAMRSLGATAQVLEEAALADRLVAQYFEIKRRQAL